MGYCYEVSFYVFIKSYPTKPGHFSRTLSKGPNTTTWIWNLHADAHDFDSHTSDLEEISRKVFSAHFGQLGIIFIWLSGCDTMTFFNLTLFGKQHQLRKLYIWGNNRWC
jgi:Photosystem I psaA/psaB protein